jgi:hypothetical protein
MALNFYTQGVDFSGLGEGIAQGMRIAAERQMQEQRMFDNDWREYSRMFDPTKISDSDRTDYINAFQENKDLAKRQLRAETGRSKENLDEIDKQLRASQAKLATIYGKSKMKNDKVLRLTKEIETAQKMGYVVPLEYKKSISTLVNTPVSKMQETDLEEEMSLNLSPKADDLIKTRTMIDKTKSNFVQANRSEEDIDLPILGKAKVFRYTPTFSSSKEANDLIIESLKSSPVNNSGVEMYKNLKAKLAMPDGTKEKEDALSAAKNIATKAGLSSIDLIEPVHLTATSMGVYDSKTTGKEVIDMSDLTTKLKQLGALNAQQKIEISKGFLAASQKNAQTNALQASAYRTFGFILRDGASAIVNNSGNIQQDLTNLGVKDIPKLMKDIEAGKNKGLSPLEVVARATANATAEENK